MDEHSDYRETSSVQTESTSQQSKSTKGRRIGSFGDPVLRMRAWHWLEIVRSRVGVARNCELDRSPIAAKLTKGLRFLSIDQDGFNPARVAATRTKTLLQHVSDEDKYSGTDIALTHLFWKHLSERNPFFKDKDEFVSYQLKKVGLVPMTSLDSSQACLLGLQWPELPKYQLNYKAFNNVDYQHFSSLDGLLLLLLIYRDAMDQLNNELMASARRTLEFAAELFGQQFSGEAKETWLYLLRARMLAWVVNYQPPPEFILKAECQLLDEWKPSSKKTGGKRRKHPLKLSKGKVERRWRRRIWVRAAGLAIDVPFNIAGYLPRNIFTGWLYDNRVEISRHLARSIELPEDWELDVNTPWFFIGPLLPLMIPVDIQHPRIRPNTSESLTQKDLYGKLPYDVVPVIEKLLGDE